MRIKDADLNAFMPKMQRDKLIREINKALETMDRIDNQIKIWSLKSISDIHTKIMQDELHYLKEGRV